MSTKFRVVLGLAGIIVSLMMIASYLGIIPDEMGAVRSGRAGLAETIAVHSTAMVSQKELKKLTDDFNIISERNSDLLSIGLRRDDGQSLLTTSGHIENWQDMEGKYSKESQVRVPIYDGDEQWGVLELRFQPIIVQGFIGFLSVPLIRMMIFMGCGCFLIYYFYLGKVLSLLDPSKAVPARVRAALDTMAEGLLVLDKKEKIVLANLAFGKMLGKTSNELVGFKAGDLPWQDSNGKQIKKDKHPWIIALEQGIILRNQTLQITLPDDKKLTFNTSCSPVLGDGDRYAGVLVSFDDITPLEEKKLELAKSKEEADSANRAKSEFLANMSHEIRTPMNAILGFTEILKRGYVRNEHDSLRYLNIINNSGKNLLELINDILDLSKIEAGHVEMEKTMTRPDRLVAEVLQILDIEAKEKGIELVFSPSGVQPETIQTDHSRLRQIIFNLVGNAVKFTESGRVVVSSRLQHDQLNPRFVIEVEDTGIGIEQEKLKLIFDPFVQAEGMTARRYGGTGLGLAISQKFARALGGDIGVVSSPGKGSRFTITVPTGSLDDVNLLDAETIISNTQPQGDKQQATWVFPEAHVLVVDDGNENRELVAFLLEEAGLIVDQANNGKVGVEKALAKSYAVILMDIQMPVMDGFTATQKLRDHGVTVPIVALTANAMKGFEQQCIAGGYSSYLSKPIDIDTFMGHMAQLLNGRLADAGERTPPTDIAEKHSAQSAPARTKPPIVSKLTLHNNKFTGLVTRFARKLGERLQEFDEAIARDDLAEVANLAHWLKGAGGTVGFDDFTQPATQLEIAAKEGNRKEAAVILAVIHELVGRIEVSGGYETESNGLLEYRAA